MLILAIEFPETSVRKNGIPKESAFGFSNTQTVKKNANFRERKKKKKKKWVEFRGKPLFQSDKMAAER